MRELAKRCVLHIGVPKTGSTAIQGSLIQASDQLAADGFLYPTQSPNHKFLVSFFSKNPEQLDFHRDQKKNRKKVEEYNVRARADLEKAMAKVQPHTLVLSSEHCVLLGPEELAEMKAYLLTLAEEVQVHVYVRHPGYQVSSLIQEQVKNGKKAFSDLQKNPPFSHYKDVISRFEQAFGRDAMRVRAFPGDPPDRSDVVRDFLEWIGAWDDNNPVKSIRANESLSAPAFLIADAMTELAPKRSGNRVGHRYLSKITGPKLALDPEIVRIALKRGQPQVDYLSREWGISLPGPDLSSAAPEPANGFDHDTIVSIAGLLNDLAAQLKEAKKSNRLARQAKRARQAKLTSKRRGQ